MKSSIVLFAAFVLIFLSGCVDPALDPDANIAEDPGIESSLMAVSMNFTAPLSGDQEVPPVDTRARGVTTFQLTEEGLSFRLTVANILNVTMAHIHLGQRGENGPVVVWLYPEGPPPELIPGMFNGILATGTITADNLVGQLEGEPLSALIEYIQNGNAYVNVHTQQHPPGEIRGQIDIGDGMVR